MITEEQKKVLIQTINDLKPNDCVILGVGIRTDNDENNIQTTVVSNGPPDWVAEAGCRLYAAGMRFVTLDEGT